MRNNPPRLGVCGRGINFLARIRDGSANCRQIPRLHRPCAGEFAVDQISGRLWMTPQNRLSSETATHLHTGGTRRRCEARRGGGPGHDPACAPRGHLTSDVAPRPLHPRRVYSPLSSTPILQINIRSSPTTTPKSTPKPQEKARGRPGHPGRRATSNSAPPHQRLPIAPMLLQTPSESFASWPFFRPRRSGSPQ